MPSRIRRVNRHLSFVPKGSKLRIGLPLAQVSGDQRKSLGIPDDVEAGFAFLPSGALGKTSARNADGEWIRHRDQPKISVTHGVFWTRLEWHGPYREEVSDIVYQDRMEYPKSFIEPIGVELQVLESPTGLVVVGPPITYDDADPLLLHHINLFLEIFGTFQSYTGDLAQVMLAPVRQVSWEVFPTGEYPWDALEKRINKVASEREGSDARVVIDRMKRIYDAKPDFVACGLFGFAGYVIFGFDSAGTYVLESTHTNNATYILGADWQTTSKLSKKEILDAGHHKARIVHGRKWHSEIGKALPVKK